MEFKYSFSRDEFNTANKKYLKKISKIMIILVILFASLCFIGASYSVYLQVVRYEFSTVVYPAFLSGIIALFFGLMILGNFRVSKASRSEFFNYYSVDGLLNYAIEITDMEAVIKYKENVTHLPLNGISRVLDLDGYLAVLFKTNLLLFVNITQDTQKLADIFTELASVKK